MNESELQQQIQIDAVQFNIQLMRNNSGAFIDSTGRMVRFGLANVSKKHSDQIKSSDLIGFTTVTITQDMIGKQLAVFTAIEVKAPDWKPSPTDKRERAQLVFIEWIRARGGFAGFANSIESFRKIIGR